MLTYEQKVIKVARALIKDFKADPKNTTINVKDEFTLVLSNVKSGYFFRHDDSKFNIFFGELNDEQFAKVTCDVADKIDGMLRLPKKMLKFKDMKTITKWSNWNRYEYPLVRKFVILTPCKSFVAVNRKLVKLGLKPIPFAEWFHGEVAGKRDEIFSVGHNYNCVNETKCNEVLNFLKGKKKLSYEIIRDEDFEDREYGIEYETEWYGHLYYRLKFTDAKGKHVII